jgi:hypothetical protein
LSYQGLRAEIPLKGKTKIAFATKARGNRYLLPKTEATDTTKIVKEVEDEEGNQRI